MTSAALENLKGNLADRLASASKRRQIQADEKERATRPTPDAFALAGQMENLNRRVKALEKSLG